MKTPTFGLIAALAFASCLTACVTAPTDPAELEAWNAEKAARTEARRPQPGSIVANPRDNAEEFDDYKEELEPAKVEQIWE